MNRIFTLLSILIACTSMTAQSVFPGYEDQPVWRLTTQGLDGAGQATAYVSRDTLACGQTWNVAQQYFTNANGQNSNIWTIGYYREEGARIYFRQNLNCGDREYLMYDFSLETGDSVWVGIPGLPALSDTMLMRVVNTYNACVLGVERKTVVVSGILPASFVIDIQITMHWIEGVGAAGLVYQHPFYSGACFEDNFCETLYHVNCLETNAGVIYGNPGAQCIPDFQRIHVNANGPSNFPNGFSWNTAFRDLQDAIAIAESGDTIVVAQGTYFPTNDTNREKRFLLKNGVVILGGFNATECLVAQRDPVLYETILSGDIGVPGDSTDNSFHVLFTLGTDSTTVLDGFTITRGQAIHPDGGSYFGHLDKGGGLYIGTIATLPHANPRIRNCRFISNVGKNGGALYCDGTFDGRSSDPILENCTFEYNRSSSSGGAIFKKGISHPERTFELRNCNFGYNSSPQEGGAIYFFDGGNANSFVNTHFYHNTAPLGGAINFQTPFDTSSIRVYNCNFSDNEAREGGAISFENFTSHPLTEKKHTIEIVDATFERNTGDNASGGAIAIYNRLNNRLHCFISKSSFLQNQSSQEGAGIFVVSIGNAFVNLEIGQSIFSQNQSANGRGSCVYLREYQNSNMLPNESVVDVHNSLFFHNTGVLSWINEAGCTLDGRVRNCTFYNNDETPFIKNWSENFNDTTFFNRLEMVNSIVWEQGSIFHNNNATNPSLLDYTLHHNLFSTLDCNLPGGGQACGQGNLFAVWPEFLDTLNRNFRLQACSPAVNAGTNEELEAPFTDLDGNPRILDNLVDMGAYERPALIDAGTVAVEPVSCFEGSDGRILWSLTGNAPYDYAWQTSTGQTGEGYENLPAGNYHFTVTDALGCDDTISVVLPQPDDIEATFSVTNASAFNTADGSIQLDQPSGGTPPYHFLWNTGDMSTSLANLLPGVYEVTVLDANDCEKVVQIEVSFSNGTDHPEDNWRLHASPSPLMVGRRLRIWQSGDAHHEVAGSLCDAQGRPVRHFSITGSNQSIDTETLPAGVYWLRWQRADGQSGVLKVLVI